VLSSKTSKRESLNGSRKNVDLKGRGRKRGGSQLTNEDKIQKKNHEKQDYSSHWEEVTCQKNYEDHSRTSTKNLVPGGGLVNKDLGLPNKKKKEPSQI